MNKQNKGEWSEFATKLEILSNNTLQVLTESGVNKACVIRSITISDKKFQLIGKSIYEVVKEHLHEKEVRFVTFTHKIKKELNIIEQKIKKGRGTFAIKEAEKLAHSLKVDTCSECNHNKGDIVLEYIKEDGTISQPELFSVKSFMGNNPTILNSSINSTRLTLRITGLTEDNLVKLQSSNLKARENINKVIEMGGGFRFIKFSDTLGANLGKLHAQKQVVFAIINHFRKNTAGASTMKMIESTSKDCKKVTFKSTMKRVLRASITGMMPSEHWNGCSSINNNLIIKKNNGQCIAFLDKESLENYLYDNCYIDSPSQTKHKYGKVYKKDGEWFIDLNFQIRLSKSLV